MSFSPKAFKASLKQAFVAAVAGVFATPMGNVLFHGKLKDIFLPTAVGIVLGTAYGTYRAVKESEKDVEPPLPLARLANRPT